MPKPTIYRPTVEPRIGRNFAVGYSVILDAHALITIGDDVFCGHGVQILTGGHDYRQLGVARQRAITARPVTIGDGVWICSGAIVCPGVTIGAHAVVGPGAVVMRNVRPYTVVGGNPARTIRRIPR